MPNDVTDLLNIDSIIQDIEEQRSYLSGTLNDLAAKQSQLHDEKKIINVIVDDILENPNSVDHLDKLKAKYGNLEVFEKLIQNINESEARTTASEKLSDIETDLNELCSQTEFNRDRIITIHDKIKDFESSRLNTLPDVQDKFDNNVLSPSIQGIANEFEQTLLNSRWDTNSFILSDSKSVNELKSHSSELFKLSKLYLNPKNEKLWNFECLANNFKIRFTYHFHNDPSSMIEIYFNFLNEYLKQNLYKCINIFSDEINGVSKELVHEQFINHILQPIRDKINFTLLNSNDSKNLITLISQIISTDKTLIKTFYYRGNGLVSLISKQVWEKWLAYEISTAHRQFDILVQSSNDLTDSDVNFIKLLKKINDYFEPFYELDYEPLEVYKLKTCSDIFIQLANNYLDFVLTVDSLPPQHSKEDELYQTILKLHSLNKVHSMIFQLSQNCIFIKLTALVNNLETKNYDSLFQATIKDYQDNMLNDMQNSIIHRIKKLIKESLANYFKLNSWVISLSTHDTNDAPSSEIVNTINLLNRIIYRLKSYVLPLEISINIKNEILNIIVNYFIESILKLNKFNQNGLAQLNQDLNALKKCLDIPDDLVNCQEATFLELLNLLTLKYDQQNVSQFTASSYIKNGKFDDLKEHMQLKWLNDSEIQDALYRISYGNII
ncbi:hypothetical protein KAFR_0B04740 [Kazachstania africana CBS 2517]|uniref:Uncharacterized protein n=1 Tax=Kazachstania africana (strain ATCC 22294 / BCRC 22015 / CBS 2517 / CECT 1963 / NBRC 1671 / NRRL Y-8276) TaxID=1071382 RepID=H2AQX1_KAZAF|nr:hypothetical protein KAFR_0B04740 [Kazachstania africana CBS 2517]CCF56771.1 hypothetical protein KAFR_0B04740 [Kazachstania africana CBS 2517]